MDDRAGAGCVRGVAHQQRCHRECGHLNGNLTRLTDGNTYAAWLVALREETCSMKRHIVLFVLFVAVCGAAYPQQGGQWQPLSADAAPSESFVWQTEPIANGLQVYCTLDGVMTRDIKEEGNVFTRLSIEGLGASGDIGTPEMPAWRRFIEVP